MSEKARDAGYDDFLDAVEDGEPYYLEGSEGDGWLPPRSVDPNTGGELSEEPLPEVGELESYTVTQVASPAFVDDAPFVVGVASFGPVGATGMVVGVDPDDVEIGMAVELGVERTETTDDRVLAFHPR